MFIVLGDHWGLLSIRQGLSGLCEGYFARADYIIPCAYIFIFQLNMDLILIHNIEDESLIPNGVLAPALVSSRPDPLGSACYDSVWVLLCPKVLVF